MLMRLAQPARLDAAAATAADAAAATATATATATAAPAAAATWRPVRPTAACRSKRPPRTDIRPHATPNTSARTDEDDDDDGGGDNSSGGGVDAAVVAFGLPAWRFASSTTPGAAGCGSGAKCGSGVSCAGSCAGCGSSVRRRSQRLQWRPRRSSRCGWSCQGEGSRGREARDSSVKRMQSSASGTSELRRAEARAVVVARAQTHRACITLARRLSARRAACPAARFPPLGPSAFPPASSSSSLPPSPASAAPGARGGLTARDRVGGRGLRAAAHVDHLAESENRARAERRPPRSAPRGFVTPSALEEERAEAETARNETLSSEKLRIAPRRARAPPRGVPSARSRRRRAPNLRRSRAPTPLSVKPTAVRPR